MIRMTVTSSVRVLLMTLLAFGSAHTDAGAQKRACGSEIRAVEINNATLHYFECGEGEPLVFVHGALGDLHTFQAQVPTFAKSYRVIAYSRRFSPPNAPPQEADVNPLSTHVADLRALIEQLKARPAHLVGNSGGAYIALELALAHPELVRSLVLGEPPVLPLLSHTSVGESMRQSWIKRFIEPSRKAFEGGSLEDGLRTFMDAICGSTTCFDNLPEARRTVLVKEQAPELRSYFLTALSATMPSLDCGETGEIGPADALGDGRAKPRDVLARYDRARTLPRG